MKQEVVKKALKLNVLLWVIQNEFDELAGEGIVFDHKLKQLTKQTRAALDKEMSIVMANNDDVNTNIFMQDCEELMDRIYKVVKEYEVKVEKPSYEVHPYVVGIDKKFITGAYIGKTPREVIPIDPAYILRLSLEKKVETTEELLSLCNSVIRKKNTNFRTAHSV